MTILTRACGAALLATFALGAAAQPIDPPGRVGRVDFAQGPVSFLAAGSSEWSAVALNRPVISGDRLWVPAGSRAELHIGSTAVRLDGQTALDVAVLDDDNVRLSLVQGSLAMLVRNIYPDERIEVGTANGAVVFTSAGRLRMDVDPGRGTTRVALASGGVTVYGERGQAVNVGAQQQVVFTGRDLAMVAPPRPGRPDAFDQWAMNRERMEERSVSARYVPREVIGYQQLDTYGQWGSDPNYGSVWYPRVSTPDWAPYRYGHWSYIEPWGWTWVDDAPWGFAPFHYGRWAQIGPRWAWIPGRPGPRPAYAPALVSFIGSVGGADISISVGGGRRGVAWVPLGPNEPWRPSFAASPRYLGNVNRAFPPLNPGAALFNQRRANAVTALDVDDFQRGRRSAGRFQRPDADDLTRARAVAAPTPDRNRIAARPEAVARATAPTPQVRSSAPIVQSRRDGDRARDRQPQQPVAAASTAAAPAAPAAPAAAAAASDPRRADGRGANADRRQDEDRRGDRDRRQDDERRREAADPRRDASAPRQLQAPPAPAATAPSQALPAAPQARTVAPQPRVEPAQPAAPQRNAADAQRSAADAQRQAAEQQRQAADQQRQAVEQQRKAADQQRAQAEQQRQAAEQRQKAADQQRQAAEQNQRAVEQQRQAADQQRQQQQAQQQRAQEQQRSAAQEQRQRGERQRDAAPAREVQQREAPQRDAQPRAVQREAPRERAERPQPERGARDGQERERPGRPEKP